MKLTNTLITWKHDAPVETQNLERQYKLLTLYILFANIPIVIGISSDIFFKNYASATVFSLLLILLNATVLSFKHSNALKPYKIYLGVFLTYSLFTYLSLHYNVNDGNFITFGIFPFVLLTLLGTKKGASLSALFIAQTALIYVLQNQPYGLGIFIGLLISLLVTTLLAGVLELVLQYEIDAVYRSTLALNDKNHRLEDLVDERTKESVQVHDQIRLQHISNHITKLPNNIRLHELYTPSKHTYGMRIRIDNPETLLAFYGYAFVNHILVAFSNNLKKLAYAHGFTLFHIHSYEFFLLGDIQEFTPLTEIQVEAFHQQLETVACIIDKQDYTIASTIGVASDSKAILTHSDIALTRAYEQDKHTLFYDKKWDYEKCVEYNMRVLQQVRTAISNDGIVPYFQPIVDAKTEEVLKYEALVRMKLSSNDVKTPAYFLGIARTAKLSASITRIMFKKVLAIATLHPYSFSLNLSAQEISNTQLSQEILQMLKKSNVSDKIVIEILESEQIQNYDIVRNYIRQLKELNISVAIDDFGSGYSNFTQIKELGADILKIDGSLVQDIATNTEHRDIVKTIITMVKQLQLKSVVEYVENQEIKNILCEMQVDFLQGYYYSEAKETIS